MASDLENLERAVGYHRTRPLTSTQARRAHESNGLDGKLDHVSYKDGFVS